VRSRTEQVATGEPVRAPRGVILIQADTLRRDHLDAYGYSRPTAPAIARLAKEGELFRNYTVQATWTKVSTPTLMTSLYPSAHTVADFTDRLPAGATTLAEVFREAGFATLSMSSILFTGQFTNLHQGFEEVHESGSLPDQQSSKTARDYVDRLLPWLDAHRDVPFFVFGQCAVGEGIGERLRALELPDAWYLVLVPPVALSTKDVFADNALTRNAKELKIPPFFSGMGANDLEPVALARSPEIGAHLAWLRARCAKARMTGSGACVFAEFASQAEAQAVLGELPAAMRGFVTRGLERHPLYDQQ